MQLGPEECWLNGLSKAKLKWDNIPWTLLFSFVSFQKNSWEISISFLLISRAQKVQDSEFLRERIQIPL